MVSNRSVFKLEAKAFDQSDFAAFTGYAYVGEWSQEQQEHINVKKYPVCLDVDEVTWYHCTDSYGEPITVVDTKMTKELNEALP